MNTIKSLLITSFIFMNLFVKAQIFINVDPSTYTSASEGDLYKDTQNKLYIGLQDGSLQLIKHDLKSILNHNNDADGSTIKNLGPPSDFKDATTKEYVDNAITFQHISINEYLASELVLARDGQIIYVVPSDLDGKNISKMQCSVYSKGSGGSNEIDLELHRDTANVILLTTSIGSGDYTGEGSRTSPAPVGTGDILRLNTTQVTTNEPEGLTCTITFIN